jgi:mannosyltransferase OCH1-like enzyme
VFQTWKSKTDIPPRFRSWSRTWRDKNPGYAHTIHDDHDNREFIRRFYPWFLGKYDAYAREILRADAVRYFYMYHYGGVYADMDFECLRPFEDLLAGAESECDVIFGSLSKDSEHSIPNAIMISKPREEVWIAVIHHLTRHGHDGHTETITGPILLKKALKDYASWNGTYPSWWDEACRRMGHDPQKKKRSRICILPPRMLYPIDWQLGDGEENVRIYPDTLAITYWTHTWK